jgi:hypothetical protein
MMDGHNYQGIESEYRTEFIGIVKNSFLQLTLIFWFDSSLYMYSTIINQVCIKPHSDRSIALSIIIDIRDLISHLGNAIACYPNKTLSINHQIQTSYDII